MQIDEFAHMFFQMEIKERFFALRAPNGDPFWDFVRFEIFLSLFDEVNKSDQLPSVNVNRIPLNPVRKFYGALSKVSSMANQWVRLKRIRPADFAVYVCSRYNDSDGGAIDFASDDAVRTLSQVGSILRIESQQNLLYDLNINTLIGIASRVYRPPATYQHYLRDMGNVIADAARKYFAVEALHLLEIVRSTYSIQLVQQRVWREVLDRSRPRLVLMTQNGIQKGLISEARKRHIPVIECQHGVINLMHPAYSYPPDLSAGETVLVPDALLLFSEYWKHQCRMPGTQMVAVGNNRFTSAGARSTRTGPAVFVSAEIFHKFLSPLAVELAQSMPNQAFIMKLHPAQLPDRAKIETDYRGIPNLAVVGMEKSIRELMADASDVIVVQSTAAYEALDHGVPVHILRKGGYVSHQDLFSRPDVHLFFTGRELREELFKPARQHAGGSRFFETFNHAVFSKFVQGLR